jgi:hypothetical protein
MEVIYSSLQGEDINDGFSYALISAGALQERQEEFIISERESATHAKLGVT